MQAWCNLQVKLCDPCLSAFRRCIKALYKCSSFPFNWNKLWTIIMMHEIQQIVDWFDYTFGSPSYFVIHSSTCQPSYLYNLLQLHQPSRALHSSTQQLLQVPYMSTDFGWRTFSYSSPATWNSSPNSVKNCSSLYSFKPVSYTHLTLPTNREV